MSTTIVRRDGKVFDNVDDKEASQLLSGGAFVPYGSPAHMAILKVKPPNAPAAVPDESLRNFDPSNRSFAEGGGNEYARGATKGIVQSAHGLLSLVPQRMYSERSRQGLRAMQEYAQPASGPEQAGKIGEQTAEFLIPAGAGRSAAKAVQVGERVMQTRNAMGQFLKATRSPLMRDLVKRALVRTGVEAGASGLVNKAQGGDFTTGAVASGAAAGGAYGVRAAAPYAARMIAPLVKSNVVKTGAGVALGSVLGTRYAGGHLEPGDVAKALMLATFASPRTYSLAGKIAPFATRATAAGALQMDRPDDSADPVNWNNEYMGGPGHKNVGP
jgi:hypothetical protein